MKPKERPQTALDVMLDAMMELLYNIQDYKQKPEYKTINMNMVTICKELNNLRIKEITKDESEN
jgi:hypothetical protein